MGNITIDAETFNKTIGHITSQHIETILIVYYVAVVIVGFTGNVLIVISVVKYKHLKSVVNIFLANLAIADVLFVVLSLFDATQFVLDEWVFGDVICRLQGTSIEVSYTVSVVTLTTVAVERYLSICYPYRKKRTIQQSIYTSIFIWIFAVTFCGALMHGYHGREDRGRYKCENDNWSSNSRLIFYLIHSVFVYLLPLMILCVTHYKISVVLALQRQRTRDRLSTKCKSDNIIVHEIPNKVSNSESEGTSKSCDDGNPKACCKKNIVSNHQPLKSLRALNRRSNIIRLLVVITTIFLLLWSPFIVVRFFKYAEVDFDNMYFRASQLLIFTNTAINFIVYALMSTSFRRAFIALFKCHSNDARMCNVTISRSKSFDIGESLRKSISNIKSVPKEEVKLKM